MQFNKISGNWVFTVTIFVLIILSSSHKVYGQADTPSCDSIPIEQLFNSGVLIDNWLLQPSCIARNDSITFKQFLNLFNPIDPTDSLLHLHEICIEEYKKINIDSINSPFFLNIPYFAEYATFRVDCISGYLVGVDHSYVNDISFFHYLELISYNTTGEIISRESLPLCTWAPYSWRKTEFEDAYIYISAKKIRFFYLMDSPIGQMPCKEIDYVIEYDGTLKKIEAHWFYETEEEYHDIPQTIGECSRNPF